MLSRLTILFRDSSWMILTETFLCIWSKTADWLSPSVVSRCWSVTTCTSLVISSIVSGISVTIVCNIRDCFSMSTGMCALRSFSFIELVFWSIICVTDLKLRFTILFYLILLWKCPVPGLIVRTPVGLFDEVCSISDIMLLGDAFDKICWWYARHAYSFRLILSELVSGLFLNLFWWNMKVYGGPSTANVVFDTCWWSWSLLFCPSNEETGATSLPPLKTSSRPPSSAALTFCVFAILSRVEKEVC